MGKIARLVVFFSLCFVALLLVSGGIRFLAVRLDWIKSLSSQPMSPLTELVAAARWALSLGLYGSVLLSLGFASREKVFAPLALVLVGVLALAFTWGTSQALEGLANVPAARTFAQPLGGPGLILVGSDRPSSTAVVLLRGPIDPGGARVVAIPGRPMQYQGEFAGRDPSVTALPPAPFRDETPWFLKSLAIDLRLNAEHLRRLMGEGLIPFLTYAGALVFLLCSLSFIFRISVWPLANLFVACLAFRGILALETFFNSPEMQEAFGSYLENSVLPFSSAVAPIFCGVGIIACLYSFLAYLAGKQGKHAA